MERQRRTFPEELMREILGEYFDNPACMPHTVDAELLIDEEAYRVAEIITCRATQIWEGKMLSRNGIFKPIAPIDWKTLKVVTKADKST